MKKQMFNLLKRIIYLLFSIFFIIVLLFIIDLTDIDNNYVNRKTIEILLENYKSEYLFYFYNEKKGEHIFSKTFDKHKIVIQKYRQK